MKEIKNKKVDKLRLMQLLQLKLLVEIKSFCSRLKIDYFLIAGTLLGSIRHLGFIPWDSDADIAMFREDYNKLIKSSHLLNDTLLLQCDETDKKNLNGFAKLRLKDTLCIEKGNKINNGNHGFYIDIFPLDKFIYSNIYAHKFYHFFYKYLIRLKAFKNGKKFSSTKIKTIISFIICFPSFFISLSFLNKIQNNISQKFNNSKSDFVNNYNSKYGLEKQYFNKDVYLPPSEVVFEGHKFKAPNKVDYWLSKIYGNYKLLPKNQIMYTNQLMKNYEIDFGKYSYLLGKPEIYVLNELNISKND